MARRGEGNGGERSRGNEVKVLNISAHQLSRHEYNQVLHETLTGFFYVPHNAMLYYISKELNYRTAHTTEEKLGAIQKVQHYQPRQGDSIPPDSALS